MLEYQYLVLSGLDEDLIGIVALQNAGNRLAARYKANDNFLASELGYELWTGLLACLLGRGWVLVFSRHGVVEPIASQDALLSLGHRTEAA